MKYVCRYRYVVWNFRLVTPYLCYLLDAKNYKKHLFLVKNLKVKVTYKYYFKFFFDLYKKRRERFKKRRRPFIYRIDLIERKVYYKRMKSRYITLRLVKFFYS